MFPGKQRLVKQTRPRWAVADKVPTWVEVVEKQSDTYGMAKTNYLNNLEDIDLN